MPERFAIMSDIHGNPVALEAVLEDIRRAKCARVFVLGDIVNGVDPKGCVEILRGRDDITCLKGNAEYYVLTPDLDTLPQHEEPTQAHLIRLMQWYKSHLSTADVAWLQSLPDLLFWNGACLVHDSPLDRLFPQRWHAPGIDPKYQEWFYHAKGITENMPADELDRLLAFMASRNLSRVFCGHTHVPFCRNLGTALICNVGGVGFPLDGDPRASWALLDEAPGGACTVAIRRVAYDVSRILRVADATPDYPDFERPALREAYKKMLVTGVHWSAYV